MPGYQADLISVRKERIFFPSSRYGGDAELDVLLDRGNAGDIEFVMVGGDVIVRDGVVTTVDEGRITDRINELSEELYQPTPEAQRRRELAAMMNVHVEELIERWYSIPISDPATIMNTTTPPGIAGKGAE
jgi:hypothetical protein